MWVDMVRMREAGQKRSKEDVLRARPERGRLTLMKASSSEVTYLPGQMEPAAFFLVRPTGSPCEVKHRLFQAVVTVIGDDSLVIVGLERLHLAGGRMQDYAQSWWCRQAAAPAETLNADVVVVNGGDIAAEAV